MATAVVAYKESFGFDAPPFTYQDFEESDVLVFVGSNLCVGHPIMWERVCRNPHAPEIIVVDPRQTETAQAATRHLQIAPKSDLALFYGLAHILIREGWIDRPFIDAHTHGFEKFADHVADFTPQAVAEWTGIDAERLFDVARVIHEGRRVSFWWTMGVNQSYEGVRTAQSLINLALMTGNIGRPGTGANSITGQANAMGSRLFSNTTNLVGGHDFRSAADRQKVAEVLSIDVGRIPTENSWAYDAIIDGIRTHKIRGLWVVCTNPAHSWIHQNQLQGLLKSLDFLVVQDMYHTTETAQHADLVLPAAGWGEKEGTFINSERRFGLLKKVARAPGEALADFEIFKLVAKYWGCGEMFADWHEPEDVFQAMKAVSAGQPCDITGIEDYVAIDRAGGIQWPCRDAAEAEDQQRRLFADGEFYHDDRRARFLFEKPATMPEPPDDLFPLLLLTGRGSVSQWHTQTRTSKSAILRKLYPQQIYVEVHPQDAERFGLADGGLARVESRRGDLTAQVFVTPTVAVGQIFIPMHYRETNRLTLPHFDPYSRQPSYKDCAVRIQPVNRLETARNGDS
jgi:assimilatory nitrate reductase catalytic subunit